MLNIRFGCQTYTWQMSGDKYLSQLPHIMRIASRAGFNGIEPETQFLGEFYEPALMVEALNKYDLRFAAVCLVEDWMHRNETERERANADRLISYLKHFPRTVLCLCQMPGEDRENLKERQTNLLSCVNEISRRAHDQGITCSYHPNSPTGSIFRTEDDYEILLNGLDVSVTGWTPDVGHIAKGGMDPLKKIKEYRSLVNHVHFKDMYDYGQWAQLGQGCVDLVGITRFLADSKYDGWIIIEDECERAEHDPDATVLDDGVFVANRLLRDKPDVGDDRKD